MGVVCVVGQSGSGKSTFARAFSNIAGIPLLREDSTRPYRDNETPSTSTIRSVTNNYFYEVFHGGPDLNKIMGGYAAWAQFEKADGKKYLYGIPKNLMVNEEIYNPKYPYLSGVIVTNPLAVFQLDALGYDIFVVMLDHSDDQCRQNLLWRGTELKAEIERRIESTRSDIDFIIENKPDIIDLYLWHGAPDVLAELALNYLDKQMRNQSKRICYEEEKILLL